MIYCLFYLGIYYNVYISVYYYILNLLKINSSYYFFLFNNFSTEYYAYCTEFKITKVTKCCSIAFRFNVNVSDSYFFICGKNKLLHYFQSTILGTIYEI